MTFAQSFTITLTLLVVLFLPGAAFLSWLRPRELDLFEWLAEAIAISIAVTALAGLFFFLTGWPVRQTWLAVSYTIFLVLFVWGSYRNRQHMRISWPNVVGLLLFSSLIGWRLYQASFFVLPPGADAVHQSLVIKEMLTIRGIPATFFPEVHSGFYFDYGIQLVTALTVRLSGLEIPKTMLLIGQVLNAVIALSVYRLGKAIFGGRVRPFLAAFLASIVLQMPAYYLVWSDLPLLGGMVLLPIMMAQVIELQRNDAASLSNQRWLPIYLQLLTAGLCLIHFRSIYIFGLFVVISMIASFWQTRRILNSLRAIWPVLFGLVLALPWLVRGQGFTAWYSVMQGVPLAGQNDQRLFADLLAMTGPFRNQLFLALGLAGAGLMVWKGPLRWLGVWTLVTYILSLPLGLGFKLLKPEYMVAILFLPAALMTTCLFSWGWKLVTTRVPRTAALGLSIGLCLLLAAWGLISTARLDRWTIVLAGQEDIKALAWIDEHLPENARFYINTVQSQSGAYQGVDGGYWLWYTGRHALIPPMIYGYGSPEAVARVNALAEPASQITTCDQQFWDIVEQEKLQYLYIKQGVGSLQPAGLVNCPSILPIYQVDGASLYEITQ
ncbi:MAG: DUF1616 domain-containing protein [Anaerolineaceae bacterium]|nr:DUF1616 domain-containing protein [Anaerolineaceae bacterium]